jgi:hypothetical protein
MKKYVAIFMTLALSFASGLTLKAANDMYVGETQGKITRVQNTSVHIRGEVLTAKGFTHVQVCVKDAPVYDLITGLSVPLSEVKAGLSARVAYIVDDKPLPYPAIVLWLNCNHDDAAVFTAMVSENIRYEEDYCVFLTTDGKYRIAFPNDMLIYDPVYGEMTPDDVAPGQEFFIWVDSITASCPALVFPDKAVLVK